MKVFAYPIAVAVLLIAFFGTQISAREIAAPEGTLRGVVMDKKGHPLHAIIRIKGPDGRKREVESQYSGGFVLPHLPPGQYSVVVISIFFDITKIKNIEVTGDQITELVVTLKEEINCCLIRSALPNPVDTTSSTSFTHMHF
jgi:hypothetical protein